jgi:hypothetical protein
MPERSMKEGTVEPPGNWPEIGRDPGADLYCD